MPVVPKAQSSAHAPDRPVHHIAKGLFVRIVVQVEIHLAGNLRRQANVQIEVRRSGNLAAEDLPRRAMRRVDPAD